MERLTSSIGEMFQAAGVPLYPASNGKPVRSVARKTAPQAEMESAASITVPALPVLDTVLTEETRAANLAAIEQFQKTIGPKMMDLIGSMRRVVVMEEREFLIYRREFQENLASVNKLLKNDNPALAVISLLAYADAMVRTCPPNWESIVDTVEKLKNREFLVPCERPEQEDPLVFRLADQYFKVNDSVSVPYPEEAEQVLQAARAVIGQAIQAFEAKGNLAMGQFIAMVRSTWEELENAKGTIVLLLPRGQGRILVKVEGPRARIIESMGGPAELQEIREQGTFVFLSQLRSSIMKANEKMDPKDVELVRMTHRLIFQSVSALGRMEAARLARKKAKELARVDPEMAEAPPAVVPEDEGPSAEV